MSQTPQQQQQQPQDPSSSSSSSSGFQQWIEQEPSNRFVPPRILEFTPQSGMETDTLRITLALADLQLVPMLRIAVGSCISPTRQTLVNAAANYVQLLAPVPNWQMTRAPDRSRTPIYVVVCNQQQQVVDNWFIAYFTYDYSRKRSSAEYEAFASASTSGPAGAPKRTRRAESISLQPDPTATYMMPPTAGYGGYPGYYGLTSSPYMGQYGQTQAQPSTGGQPTMGQRSPRGYYEGTTVTPAQMMGYPYRTSSLSGETGLGYPPEPSMLSPTDDATAAAAAAAAAGISMGQMPPQQQAGAAMMPGSHHPPTAGSPGMQPYMMQQQQPPAETATSGSGTTSTHYLAPAPHQQHNIAPAPAPIATSISTSSIPGGGPPSATSPTTATTPVSATGGGGGGSGGSYYDPYAHILNKANLHVEGNLDDMLHNWTEEEWMNQRRLVRFWRRQEGNEVICSFTPISQSERPNQQNMIVVSCIYWKERDDYYITSVDCIYLLESLIAVRFTVEEKNRIRRNLEGFRPLTVSKLRQDSAEFFKLIMAFPNPKPRNIEKDVKVFPWKSLGMALKKIISKYTASYSSTASVNLEALGYSGGSGGSTSTTSTTAAAAAPAAAPAASQAGPSSVSSSDPGEESSHPAPQPPPSQQQPSDT